MMTARMGISNKMVFYSRRLNIMLRRNFQYLQTQFKWGNKCLQYIKRCIRNFLRVLVFTCALVGFGIFISGIILRLLSFSGTSFIFRAYTDSLVQNKYSFFYIRSKQNNCCNLSKTWGDSAKEYAQTHLTNRRRDKISDIPVNDKIWTRVSDEVFVYSAYLDTRNFSTSYSIFNNSLQRFPEGRIVSSNNAEQQGQRLRAGDDSDKLNHAFLIRIVGMKAVPPLREFLKGDVLDWFRMKHELDYSQKYKCKLFFSTSPAASTLQSVSSQRVTYTVIEEGVKIYAGCYINCYFAMNSSVYQTIKSVALANNLQVALYPTVVPDYPTKLIDVGTKMILTTTGNNEDERKIPGGNSSNIHFREKSLAICVRPLFGPFDDLEKLIQFISYYHLVGVTRLNFYAMSISPRVRKYLLGVIAKNEDKTTVPHFLLYDWNLPTGNTSELWDYGTLAALNDCLFANVDQEFVAFVDIDEFIVPRIPTSTVGRTKGDHLSSLWTIIDSYNKTETYQYLIRNTFFCHEFCEKLENETKNAMNSLSQLSTFPTTEEVKRKPDMIPILSSSFPANNSIAYNIFKKEMLIFKCFARTKRVWNVAMRSKFIVNPREVLAVGHHLSTKYVKNIDFRFSGKSVQVDPTIALLHHYRECSSISSQKHPILTRLTEIDKTIQKFQVGVLDKLYRYYLPQFVTD